MTTTALVVAHRELAERYRLADAVDDWREYWRGTVARSTARAVKEHLAPPALYRGDVDELRSPARSLLAWADALAGVARPDPDAT